MTFDLLMGGTSKVRRLSWVVGTVYRIIQGCYGAAGIVPSVQELKLGLEVTGWWTGLLGTAIARAEQPMVMKGNEWQQKAGLL